MRQQRTGTSSPLILIPIFSSLFSGSSSPCRTKWKYIKRVIVLYFLVGQVHWFVKFLLLGFVQFESQPSVDNSLSISRSLFLVCCLPGYFVYSWHDFSICPWSTWNAKAAPFLLRPIYWLWDFDNLYPNPYPYVAHPGLFRLYIYAFMFMYLIASLQFRLSCILPRRIWKLRWHGKVFDKRFKAHPWLTFLFFFFFLLFNEIYTIQGRQRCRCQRKSFQLLLLRAVNRDFCVRKFMISAVKANLYQEFLCVRYISGLVFKQRVTSQMNYLFKKSFFGNKL